jgi:hypothetical protein
VFPKYFLLPVPVGGLKELLPRKSIDIGIRNQDLGHFEIAPNK